jgi:hypothetical protein
MIEELGMSIEIYDCIDEAEFNIINAHFMTVLKSIGVFPQDDVDFYTGKELECKETGRIGIHIKPLYREDLINSFTEEQKLNIKTITLDSNCCYFNG